MFEEASPFRKEGTTVSSGTLWQCTIGVSLVGALAWRIDNFYVVPHMTQNVQSDRHILSVGVHVQRNVNIRVMTIGKL